MAARLRRAHCEGLPRASQLRALTAELGEGIVGFAIGGPTQVDHGSGDRDRAGSAGVGEIFAIYVLPEYQGYGIGCTLFQALVRELQNRGFRPLELRVLKANQQARSFYERQGV